MDLEVKECLPPFVLLISFQCRLNFGIVGSTDSGVLWDSLATKHCGNKAMKKHCVFLNGLQLVAS